MWNAASRQFFLNQAKPYPYATGGDYVYLYEEGNKTYRVHEFLSTGTSTLNVEVGGQMDILVVGGGGGGGSLSDHSGGGGGAGLFIEKTGQKIDTGIYSVQVGAGGTGDSTVGNSNLNGENDGNPSSFSGNSVSLIADGGGGGGEGFYAALGRTGGSGGGAGGKSVLGGSVSGGASTASDLDEYGNAGGSSFPGNGGNSRAGGGGGAGSTGFDATSGSGGNGGSGRQWLNGKIYAAGGGGSAGRTTGTNGSGGSGIGGNGGTDWTTAPTNGVANTGSGGGGARNYNGGNGGSGIVIVRYVVAEKKLWTPSELTTLAAWYKADSLSQSDDTEISTWSDSSGNGYDLTGYGTPKPKFRTNVLNSLPVVRFNASGTLKRTTWAGYPSNNSAITVSAVVKRAAGGDCLYVSAGPVGNYRQDLIRVRSDNKFAVLRRTISFRYAEATTTISNGNFILLAGQNSSAQPFMNFNGTQQTLTFGGAYTDLTLTDSTPTDLTIGGFSDGTPLPNNDEIAEVVICDTEITIQDRQKLEGYLAHKWGLTNNLPSGHPYKYEPPYKVEPEDIVTDGLVLNLDAGDYASYPRSGTTWYDISGNGLNGTLTNGPTYDSANKGSIVFDGVNDYALVGNASSNQITTSLTLEAWVYPTQFDHTNISEVIAKWDNRQYKLTIAGTIFGVPYGYFYIDVSDTGSNDNYRRSSSTLTLNSWNHIVGVYTSGASPSLNVYLNGTLSNGNLVGSVPSSIYNGTSPVYIGSHGGRDFKGNIATARIYNRALSSTEISQNFNALRGRYGI